MARFPSDPAGGRLRGPGRLAASLLLVLALAPAGRVAEMSGELQIESSGPTSLNFRERVYELRDVTIRHGADMRAKASVALNRQLPGNITQLDLSGSVHIEFGEAVLDAATAVMRFRGNNFLSVQVDGAPAEFSHQPEGFPRRIQGRAGSIRYETATGKVVFSGETFFTDGCISTTTRNPFSYDINTGTGTDDGDPASRGRTTNACLNPGRDRIPTPRTPERDSAQ